MQLPKKRSLGANLPTQLLLLLESQVATGAHCGATSVKQALQLLATEQSLSGNDLCTSQLTEVTGLY